LLFAQDYPTELTPLEARPGAQLVSCSSQWWANELRLQSPALKFWGYSKEMAYLLSDAKPA
jgi:hypothetical protein